MEGLLLSLDGIQPDKGNETMYVVRDVLTGRILTAENVTSSPKAMIKQVLAPVVALQLPIIGVISDALESQVQAVAELWPDTPHHMCQFHAKRARRTSHVRVGSSHQDRYAHSYANLRHTSIDTISIDV